MSFACSTYLAIRTQDTIALLIGVRSLNMSFGHGTCLAVRTQGTMALLIGVLLGKQANPEVYRLFVIIHMKVT